jgi:hypothetical protein
MLRISRLPHIPTTYNPLMKAFGISKVKKV